MYLLPVAAVLASIRLRNWFAKAGMFETGASKSKSKPSITESPNGRGEVPPGVLGPKIDQILFAAETAAPVEPNPPSVYVAPPIERTMVFPYVC